jgi:hypothetical protein
MPWLTVLWAVPMVGAGAVMLVRLLAALRPAEHDVERGVLEGQALDAPARQVGQTASSRG